MEFDELQKIWDTQNNQPLYVINEQALHNRIVAKKHQVIHIAVVTEWILIIANTASGAFVLQQNVTGRRGLIFVYLLAVWMLGTAVYVLVNRIRRMRKQQQFNRSLNGDLQHALSTASYQVRTARIMRWNTLPIGLLVLFSSWEGGHSVWFLVIVALFFVLVFFASGWEMGIYRNKMKELQVLQHKLQEDGL
jgi:4-hydroxybenzoate polyprenyltransferase